MGYLNEVKLVFYPLEKLKIQKMLWCVYADLLCIGILHRGLSNSLDLDHYF